MRMGHGSLVLTFLLIELAMASCNSRGSIPEIKKDDKKAQNSADPSDSDASVGTPPPIAEQPAESAGDTPAPPPANVPPAYVVNIPKGVPKAGNAAIDNATSCPKFQGVVQDSAFITVNAPTLIAAVPSGAPAPAEAATVTDVVECNLWGQVPGIPAGFVANLEMVENPSVTMKVNIKGDDTTHAAINYDISSTSRDFTPAQAPLGFARSNTPSIKGPLSAANMMTFMPPVLAVFQQGLGAGRPCPTKVHTMEFSLKITVRVVVSKVVGVPNAPSDGPSFATLYDHPKFQLVLRKCV